MATRPFGGNQPRAWIMVLGLLAAATAGARAQTGPGPASSLPSPDTLQVPPQRTPNGVR